MLKFSSKIAVFFLSSLANVPMLSLLAKILCFFLKVMEILFKFFLEILGCQFAFWIFSFDSCVWSFQKRDAKTFLIYWSPQLFLLQFFSVFFFEQFYIFGLKVNHYYFSGLYTYLV